MDCHSAASSEGEIRDAVLTQASNPPNFVWEEVKNIKYQFSCYFLSSIKIVLCRWQVLFCEISSEFLCLSMYIYVHVTFS